MEFISVIFRAITGLKLTPESAIVLGFFFALGWLFGKLTRRIGIIKDILLAIFGGVALLVLSIAPGFVVIMFVAGVLTNHGPLLAQVIYWAQDLADIYYALQYRQAFEDIRAQEARMEEELRQARAQAYTHAHSQGESATQDRWRQSSGRGQEEARAGEKEKADRGADQRHDASGGRAGSGKPRNTTPGSSRRDTHLVTLGLQPGQRYGLAEIKKAYRRRAKVTHPDAGGTAQEFMEVRAAWVALSAMESAG